MRSSATPCRSIATIVAHNPSNTGARDLVAGSARVDPVDEQRLGPVHVADAAHHLLLEQQLSDRRKATNDRSVRLLRVGVVSQRVGTESANDAIAILVGADRTVGRAGEIDGRLRHRQTHSHRRRIDRRRDRGAHETCRTGRGVRGRPNRCSTNRRGACRRPRGVEASSVDERRIAGEATLRRRYGDVLAAQHLGMIDGNSVNGVTLGHAGRDVTGTLGAS